MSIFYLIAHAMSVTKQNIVFEVLTVTLQRVTVELKTPNVIERHLPNLTHKSRVLLKHSTIDSNLTLL